MAETVLLKDVRSVSYSRIDGFDSDSEDPEATFFVSEASFGEPEYALVLDDVGTLDGFSWQPDFPRDIRSESSLIHDSSVSVGEDGRFQLSALMGFSSHTTGVGFGDPAAGGSGELAVRVRFDTPQQYRVVLDVESSGDEASLSGSLLNGAITYRSFGISGASTFSGLGHAPQGTPWNPFAEADPRAGVGLAGLYVDSLDLVPVPLVWEGVLEPGEYDFDIDLRGGADGEDPYVLTAAYLDFQSSPILDLAGDANRDEVVDQADLNAVLNNWGLAVSERWAGDLTGDGTVDQGDLNAVLNGWGSAATPDFRGAVVPEPGAAWAAILLGGGLWTRSRGR